MIVLRLALGNYRREFKNIYLKYYRYIVVSIGMYLYIFIAMYLLVDRLGFDATPAFILVYLIAYFLDYLLTLRYVFDKDHGWKEVAKFILHILFFLGCGSLLFRGLVSINAHYLVATFLTALTLMPLRFLAHKFLVFR